MFKRILAAVLWFAAASAVWNAVAFIGGWNDSVGPIVGIAAAGLVGLDPLHLLWPARPAGPLIERLAAAGVIQA